MRLLFIQGGSRWKMDQEGNLYTDGNFNNDIWHRYRNYCDELVIMLRSEKHVYDKDEARSCFNAFDPSIAEVHKLADIYRPVKNVVDLRMHREIRNAIEKEVRRADKIIIRSVGTFYTTSALKLACKHGKPYLVEVTGFSWESLWYHSLRGKIVALFNEIQCKQLIRRAPWVVYVTRNALQHRYPSEGKFIGCSDVELGKIDEAALQRRIDRIQNGNDGRLVIGTAAFLNVGWKGQKYVIQAIARMRRKGIDAFEYELIGGGTGEHLMRIAERLGVSDRVHFLGVKPHKEVFDWMDRIDIYVQPSFMEGLCRSLVEAMSRACPVVASNVGGNSELVSQGCLFPKGNVMALERILLKMRAPELRVEEAKRGFELSKEYIKEELDKKRDAFYWEFIAEQQKT